MRATSVKRVGTWIQPVLPTMSWAFAPGELFDCEGAVGLSVTKRQQRGLLLIDNRGPTGAILRCATNGARGPYKCDGWVLKTTNSKDLCLSLKSRAGVTFSSYESFSRRLMVFGDLGCLSMVGRGASKFLQCLAGARTDDVWTEVSMSSKSARSSTLLVLNV